MDLAQSWRISCCSPGYGSKATEPSTRTLDLVSSADGTRSVPATKEPQRPRLGYPVAPALPADHRERRATGVMPAPLRCSRRDSPCALALDDLRLQPLEVVLLVQGADDAE